MYSRTVAIIGGFLVLASGAGELYRRKPRSRSLQSTGQVFLGIYLICVVCWGLLVGGAWLGVNCESRHGRTPEGRHRTRPCMQFLTAWLPENCPGQLLGLRALQMPVEKPFLQQCCHEVDWPLNSNPESQENKMV